MPTVTPRRRRHCRSGEPSWFHRIVALACALTLLPGPLPVAYAADILRPGIRGVLGGGPVGTQADAGAGAGTGAEAAATSRVNAQDMLSRNTQAIQAVQNMQTAARAAAISGANHLGQNPNLPGQTLPNVPNGLGVGGLDINGAPIGATAPVQALEANGRTLVNIVQEQQQAFINWNTFNIGKTTTLNFDQSAGGASVGEWIVFNKITDPTGNPTQILGNIQAQGQVYVLNQNGIIFGGSSQVNTHTLVASALPINDNLVSRGLLNQQDVQFLFSAVNQSAGAKGTPAHTPPASFLADGKVGDVTVQAGAIITSPTSVEKVGGRVALIGANVTNHGSIATPDGQTILAAGLQVGFAAHNSSDPSLRGLDVYVGDVGTYAGTVTNDGLIDTPRGNVTMTGKVINQNGVITSTTSVAFNGRIDLDASYNAVSNASYNPILYAASPPYLSRTSGQVSLGAGSVTQILPEWASKETVVGTQLALVSQINLRGLSVHFAEDSALWAPNAKVSINAGIWDYVSSVVPPSANFVNSGGQIYIDAGAVLNVAGSSDIEVPVSQYLLTVQLRSNELADSPLQRNGALRGETITVDLRETGTFNGRIWYGTPLADLSGYVGIIQKTVGELTTAAGSIELAAGSSVVVQKDAVLDVSGGWVNVQQGQVTTSQVVSSGQIISIADATPDRVYSGLYTGTTTITQPAWGTSTTTTAPFSQDSYLDLGYFQGANAGKLNISSFGLALDGTLRGTTVVGSRQRAVQPDQATLALRLQAQASTEPYALSYPTPTVYLRSGVTQSVADAFALDANGVPLSLRSDRQTEINLSPALVSEFGFGHLNVQNVDGRIIVPETTSLVTAPKGSIILAGAGIDVDGDIIARGGDISLTAYNLSPAASFTELPAANAGRGNVRIGAAAVLNTSGLILDDRVVTGSVAPLVLEGGNISINAMGVTLAAGGILDVSGGAQLKNSPVVTYGDAGSISLKSGQDVNLLGVLGGGLTLGSELRGFSGAQGGTLTIQAPAIQVGGTTTTAETLLLTPDFFNQGGFSSFTMAGLGRPTLVLGEFSPAILISAGTQITPIVKGWELNPTPQDQSSLLKVFTRQEGLRNPVSLNFKATGVLDQFASKLVVRGEIIMEKDAVIKTDALGAVNFEGETVAVAGTVISPGGAISISGANRFASFDDVPVNAFVTVNLAPTSLLSTAGKTLLLPNAFGLRKGSVLAGGTINVSGNIVAEIGAVLDASGTSGTLDLTPGEAGLLNGAFSIPVTSGLTTPLYNGAVSTPVKLDSQGGTITLKGGQMLFVDALLSAERGGSNAAGGTLEVSSGRFYLPGIGSSPNDIDLWITQNTLAIPAPIYSAGGNAIGRVVRDSGGAAVISQGYFKANSFTNGGFDSLTLRGNVQFSGPVTLSAAASLHVATGGIFTSDAAVNLNATYVSLGQAFRVPMQSQQDEIYAFTQGSPFFVSPAHGAGSLNVNAGTIDIGFLSLQNTGSAEFVANNGDIRGSGSLNIAGDIIMRAGQIYTPTASTFTIAAYDYTNGSGQQRGSITFESSGVRGLPLSAGGTLNVYAHTINQGGTLVAPAGIINLGWDGRGASPLDLLSGAGIQGGVSLPTTANLNMLTGSRTSVSQIDPITGLGIVIPYGFSSDGLNWIDPQGVDISGGGLAVKAVNTSALSINSEANSVVDLRGGGDLYAFRWLKGTGGTLDILESEGSFAILPNYTADYAPFGRFNETNSTLNLASSQSGYRNSTLHAGDRIYLNGGSGLQSGNYTLLPARYALLSGAFLVTPKTGEPLGSVVIPGGASLVSGYRFNSLNPNAQNPGLYSSFEVAPGSVVDKRVSYEDYSANTFLKQRAAALNLAAPLVPVDAGRLLLQAVNQMTLLGQVRGSGYSIEVTKDGATKIEQIGRGAAIDISSPSDILIASTGTTAASGVLVLDAGQLSAFGSSSLLIGGQRNTTTAGTLLTTSATNITLANSAASPLAMPELILAATGNITLNAGATITQTGTLASAADTLSVSGNGALLRVSADASAQMLRSGVTTAAGPALTIGSGVNLTGTSLTLDSTSVMNIDPAAVLAGQTLNINSSRISLQLTNPGALEANPGLVLTGTALQSIQNTKSLALLSYSSIDFYGTGQIGSALTTTALSLRAGELRGFNNGGGTVTLAAQNLLLDNFASGTVPGAVTGMNGTLALQADTLRLGANTLMIDQFANVNVTASKGILGQGAGSLIVQGAFNATTPVIAGDAFSAQAISAGGSMTLAAASGTPITGGLGATLSLSASSMSVGSDIVLPSGKLTLATTSGNLDVSGKLNVGGTAQTFFDQIKYTDGGRIDLISSGGSVNLLAGSFVNIAANAAAGNAGTLAVTTTTGTLNLGGTLSGTGGTGGQAGSFVLTAGNLPILGALSATLNNAGLNGSRSIRVLNGDVLVDGTTTANVFDLSADRGSITVTGLINASGVTGGSVTLQAAESVTLTSTASITAAAQKFDRAGKGGSISLMAGSQRDGLLSTSALLDLQTGSQIDLSVATNIAGSTLNAVANTAINVPANLNGYDTITATQAGIVTLTNGSTINLAANTPTSLIGALSVTLSGDGDIAFAGSAAWGLNTGTLNLRAPQNAAADELQMNAINAQITGASLITAEGYKIFTPTSGTLNAAALTSITSNATTFTGNTNTITDRLLASNNGLRSQFFLVPGAEVINRAGDLTLGTNTSTIAAGDWNLATARFGPKSVPGILTMRAAGNMVFFNSLNDGFTTGAYNSALLAFNASLPSNLQSWSYRLAAGSDFNAVDFHQVQSQTALATDKGSLQIGRNAGAAIATIPGATATTALVVNPTATTGRFQVIRTGSGNIDIASGRDVQFLNVFASIYTAGTAVENAMLGGTFDVPRPDMSTLTSAAGSLGANQQSPRYPAQYSMAGGNVTINAQGDVTQLTRNIANQLVAESRRQLPTNWLYRRGAVDPVSGFFARSRYHTTLSTDIASTSWWVDFSNFFQSVGALGGGNVTLIAGRDISNVDAVVPTNARMQGKDSLGNAIAPNANNLIELGGGDLIVRSGRNIDGGVYYVERGTGTLAAGDSIRTNSTRSASLNYISSFTTPSLLAEQTWMPTTLLAGKSSFNINARGDVLLGPVANVSLLPQGYSNSYWYKTYFSTYAADSSVNVTSLAGDVTLRSSITLPSPGTVGTSVPILQAWYQNHQLLGASTGANGGASSSFYQPWLKLVESSVRPFTASASLLPGALRVTAFAGDLSVIGSLNLSPSSQGALELFVSGAISGLNANGSTTLNGVRQTVWGAGRINLSDANPDAIPGLNTPFAYQNLMPSRTSTSANATRDNFLAGIDSLFLETGSTTGSKAALQAKQALHAAGLLHADDTSPVYIYANSGSINGLTVFSAKSARVIGGLDVSDVSLYLQNNRASDLSLVSAGRDLIAYNANTPQRVNSRSLGNVVGLGEDPLAGDIQISGPGTLQVLAGRNIDLGTGSNNPDGTGVGITSIGNGRNPYLPFEGSDIFVAAGMGNAAVGLSDSAANFNQFITQVISVPGGDRYLAEAVGILGLTQDPSKTEAEGIQVSSVNSGGAAQLAGIQPGDTILKIAGKEVNGNYDDSYLSYGMKVGESTKITVLRDDLTIELDITPGNKRLNLQDPLLTLEQQKQLTLSVYNLVLRDAGRDYNNPDSVNFRSYEAGFNAVKALLPTKSAGGIFTQARDIRTRSGGDITLLSTDGGLALSPTVIGQQLAPPGIVTESGGNISIFTDDSVDLGISRIFTLKGGDISIWSSSGDIAAGSSAKTVQSAPPTRVLIDPQSANVTTDLAGLATGGGIGALATVGILKPSNIDLIAPIGAVDAGDAGIRATGNLNIAASVVLNAGNIQASGSTSGAPSAPSVSSPSMGGLAAAASSGAATNTAAAKPQGGEQQKSGESKPLSVISVEILGYGGGSDDDETKKKKVTAQL
jgi:filamentous hemagglutinin